MGSLCCGECDTELELDRANRKLVCPNCGCTFDADADDIADWDGEECSDESLSVYEAAQIWASHGKDEDYMFGYSESELQNAL